MIAMASANTLSNNIAEALKLKIIAGEYAVDNKLPNEQVLSEHFNASRSTIREAIKTLASKNIVTIQRGRGTYVNENPGLIEDPLGLEFVQRDVAVQDICEMRFFVEPIASYLAAQRATEKQLETMEELVRKMQELSAAATDMNAGADILHKEFSECESCFHSMLYEMTNNTIFKRFQSPVMALIHSFYYEYYSHKDYEYETAYTNHNKLFQAIKSKDKTLAFQYAKAHLLDMPPFLVGQPFVLKEGIDLQIVASLSDRSDFSQPET